MKNYFYILGILALLVSSCTQEPPTTKVSIEPAALTVESGDPLPFEISGTTSPANSFITFYSGTPSARYEDYPNATAINVGIPYDSAETEFVFNYTYNFHGMVRATFITRGYGNWSEDQVEEIIEFDIEVIDNNTAINSATASTGGIFGDTFEGTIDSDANKVVFVGVSPGLDLSAIGVNIGTSSGRATVLLGNRVIEPNDQVDFSSRSLVFTVEAASGVRQDWTFELQE